MLDRLGVGREHDAGADTVTERERGAFPRAHSRVRTKGGFGQPESPNLQRSAAGYGSGNDAVELCYTSLHRSPPTCSIASNALILSQPLAKRPHKSCGKQPAPVFFQLDQRHSRNDDEGGGQPPRTHASNDLGTAREGQQSHNF
ncbi:hypothetical protein PGQ11_004031 [Apiospora arundinis]|uniref:Uncharacterized protein n=1 Tax=Apiospora arundinis TaxID=335852 RepID=A0ABR2J7V6_9PEZI